MFVSVCLEALTNLSGSYGGKAADVWQLGITLYALVFGFVPFCDSNIVNLYYKIQHEPLVFPRQPLFSSALQDLISKMLQKDPSSRITISEIKVKGQMFLNSFRNSISFSHLNIPFLILQKSFSFHI